MEGGGWWACGLGPAGAERSRHLLAELVWWSGGRARPPTFTEAMADWLGEPSSGVEQLVQGSGRLKPDGPACPPKPRRRRAVRPLSLPKPPA